MGAIRLVALCVCLSLSVTFDYAVSSTYTNSAVDHFKLFLNQSMERRHRELSSTGYDLLWDVVQNVWFIGFFIGIFFSPLCNSRFGRKATLVVGNTVILLSSIARFLSIWFYLPELLIGSRLVSSFVTAVTYQTLVLCLVEVPPRSYRGAISCIGGASFALMAMVGMALASALTLRQLMALTILPCALSLLFVCSVPDTAPHLEFGPRRDRAAALQSRRFYCGNDWGENDPFAIDDSGGGGQQQSEKIDTSEVVSVREWWRDMGEHVWLRRAFLLSMAAMQGTVPLWTILLSSTDLLEKAGLGERSAAWSSTAMAATYAIGNTASTVLVERIGRRRLLIFSNLCYLCTITSYCVFAWLKIGVSGWASAVCLVTYGAVYGVGISAVSWFIPAELCGARYRSLVTSVVYAINTAEVVVGTFATGPLIDLIGPSALLILYVLPSLPAFLYLLVRLPETAGQSTEQIQRRLLDRKTKAVSLSSSSSSSSSSSQK